MFFVVCYKPSASFSQTLLFQLSSISSSCLPLERDCSSVFGADEKSGFESSFLAFSIRTLFVKFFRFSGGNF